MTQSIRRAGGDCVAAALTDVHHILKGVSDTPLWSSTDAQITELLVEATRIRNQLAALELRIVAEADGRDIASRAAASSTPSWLRGTVNLSPAEAKRRVALATALNHLQPTRQALTDGSVSAPHAQVIARCVAELPDEVTGDVRASAESFLVEHAQQFDPVQLARLGSRILEVVDPDAADIDEARRLANQEKRAHQRRDLRLTPDGHGTVWLRGRLDTESAAIVQRALDPLAAPRPTDADQPDLRNPGCRAADALIEVCRRALSGGGLPTQRSEKPQVVVTVDYHKLRRDVGSGTTDHGATLAPATVRRIACDAELIPAVLGADSRPLDLGRAVRLFTPAQRRALILRDRGCAFPGCDRPPQWCDAHHIRHWIDGGDTNVDNGVLLCGYHHRVIHKGEWVVEMTDGHPEFVPPRRIDPRQIAVRHLRHRRRE
ncbi:MAG: DUF222 domain-containing protein [Micromonosporaceae bacterium]